MFYPEFLKEGDYIGICAPSAGAGGKQDSFDASLEALNEAGFQTVETESVRSEDCPSAPAQIRGEEFNSLYADEDIAMVMSACGGDYVMEMLPYIDQDLVKSNPKWFSGYSDPTSIQMLLTTKLDIATMYGANAGAWDWRPLHEFQYNSLSLLGGEIPVQHSYDLWASHGFNEETGEYEMDEPVEWVLVRGEEAETDEDYDGPALYEFEEESYLDVTGRLIGGCIDVIDWIVGTPYEDLEGFCKRYQEDGFIWFFDIFEMTPAQLMYAVLRLRQKGLFDDAKAVIFGRPCFRGEADDIDYLEQMERVFADLQVPVIWNADIGHTKPSFMLINGAMGHLAFEDGQAELSMELI